MNWAMASPAASASPSSPAWHPTPLFTVSLQNAETVFYLSNGSKTPENSLKTAGKF
jgi:hypothetical protein